MIRIGRIILLLPLIAFGVCAESGYDAWLRYQALPPRTAEADVQTLGQSVTLLGSSEILLAARDEFTRGTLGMLLRIPGTKLRSAPTAVSYLES